jgi:hypothetical protein
VQSGASVSVMANQFKIRENQVEKFNLFEEQYLVQQIYSTE